MESRNMHLIHRDHAVVSNFMRLISKLLEFIFFALRLLLAPIILPSVVVFVLFSLTKSALVAIFRPEGLMLDLSCITAYVSAFCAWMSPSFVFDSFVPKRTHFAKTQAVVDTLHVLACKFPVSVGKYRRNFGWLNFFANTFLYLVFVSCLTLYFWRPSSSRLLEVQTTTYMFRSSLQAAFTSSLPSISSIADIYSFISTAVIPNMAPVAILGQRNIQPNLRFSELRLRVLRVRENSCFADSFLLDRRNSSECLGIFLPENMATAPYASFKFSRMPSSSVFPFYGSFGIGYPSDGFVASLPVVNISAAQANLSAVWNSGFVDSATRALFVEFAASSRAFGCSALLQILFEITPTSAVFPKYELSVFAGPPGPIFVAIGALAALGFIGSTFYLMLVQGDLFRSRWMYVRVIIVLFILISATLSVIRNVVFPLDSVDGHFDDIVQGFFFVMADSAVLSVLLVLCWFFLIRFLATIPPCGAIIEAIFAVFLSSEVITFLFVYFFFLVSIAIGYYFLVGPAVSNYNSVASSLMSVFRTALYNTFDYESVRSYAPTVGPLIFALSVLVLVVVLTNILIAIINSRWERGYKSGGRSYEAHLSRAIIVAEEQASWTYWERRNENQTGGCLGRMLAALAGVRN